MSLSSARNYALRASKSQDQKEAIELLSKAILELALSIEATDAKVKKINKSSFEARRRGLHLRTTTKKNPAARTAGFLFNELSPLSGLGSPAATAPRCW